MSRYYGGSSEEHQPVTWVGGYPVYATHFVVAVFAISMIVSAVALRMESALFLVTLPFSSPAVLNGEIWRVFTYGFVNPPSLGFVIDMVLVVWFGREVEKHFGRKTFLWFYAGLYLVTPLILTLVGLQFPMSFAGATGALAVFTAFATIHPGAPLMFNVLAKWAAIILIATFTLVHFSYRAENQLLSLWATNLYAFLFVRHYQGRLELPRLRLWKRKPKLRVLPDLKPAKPERTEKPALTPALKPDSMAEVDALLDKIAKHGISSLTPKERAKLEAAREGLLKRSTTRD